MNDEIAELKAEVMAMKATLVEILEKVDLVVENVGPVIDQVASHPMLKMFFGGKGR